jgi:hypothetical protein
MNNFDICKLSCFIFFIFFVVLFWICFSIFNVDELRNFVVTLLIVLMKFWLKVCLN